MLLGLSPVADKSEQTFPSFLNQPPVRKLVVNFPSPAIQPAFLKNGEAWNLFSRMVLLLLHVHYGPVQIADAKIIITGGVYIHSALEVVHVLCFLGLLIQKEHKSTLKATTTKNRMN